MTRTILTLVVLTTLAPSTVPAGGREGTIAKLRELLRLHPGSAPIQVRLASHLVRLADENEQEGPLTESRRLLTQALAADPRSIEARGWMGVARLVQAKYGSGSTAKSLALLGLKELDGAVARDPAHLRVVMMRGAVDLKVPREWGRLPQAREDLLRIEHAIRRKPELATRYGIDVAELYLRLGQALQATGDLALAMKSWAQAAKLPSGDRFGREAARLLKKYSE